MTDCWQQQMATDLQQTAEENNCTVQEVIRFLRTLDTDTCHTIQQKLQLQSPSWCADENVWLPIYYSLPGIDCASHTFYCKQSLFDHQWIRDQIGLLMKNDDEYVNTKHWPYYANAIAVAISSAELKMKKFCCAKM
jgi:hypothetical protein